VGGGAGLERPAMKDLAGARGAGGCSRTTEVLNELRVRHAQRGRRRACHGVGGSKEALDSGTRHPPPPPPPPPLTLSADLPHQRHRWSP